MSYKTLYKMEEVMQLYPGTEWRIQCRQSEYTDSGEISVTTVYLVKDEDEVCIDINGNLKSAELFEEGDIDCGEYGYDSTIDQLVDNIYERIMEGRLNYEKA